MTRRFDAGGCDGGFGQAYFLTMPASRRPITCKFEDKLTTGFVERRDVELSERVWRSLKIFGICFGLALLSVPIPVLHFVLVPGFLLGSILLGREGWKTKAEILQGEFTCPNCNHQHEIQRRAEHFPYSTRCERCFFSLTASAVGEVLCSSLNFMRVGVTADSVRRIF